LLDKEITHTYELIEVRNLRKKRGISTVDTLIFPPGEDDFLGAILIYNC
jgi:hypothetical protein